MGLFYSFIDDLIPNNEINEQGQITIEKPCGQSGCCSLHPHLKQQTVDPQPTSPNITTRSNPIYPAQTNRELSTNKSNNFHTSSDRRSYRRRTSKDNSQTRSQKSKNNPSPRYCLLSKDEERLLEHVLDAYIIHKGSQDLMAQSLSQKLNTDIRKMEMLCETLCQLIEAKIQ